MTIGSKEHYEMIAMFEKVFAGEGRFDKEPKEFWTKGNIYQNGEINKLFIAFRHGVAFGTAITRAL